MSTTKNLDATEYVFDAAEFVRDYSTTLGASSLATMSEHQLRVTAFCAECAEHQPLQHVNHTVTNKLTKAQAILRAKLQLEEVLELIRGLGVGVRLAEGQPSDTNISIAGTDCLSFAADGEVNLKEIIDGLCDDSVIAKGTASLLGIPLAPFEAPTDYNNLNKFKPGHYFREDGKLVKPADHPAPDLESVLSSITGGLTFADFPNYKWSDVE